VFTHEHVGKICAALAENTPAVVSVFAGRIADTGRDPVPHMGEALALLRNRPKAELLWASPRELGNIFQADEIGCHIITVTGDVIKKLALVGKGMDAYSRVPPPRASASRSRPGRRPLSGTLCRLPFPSTDRRSPDKS
jgi:transaldolase